MLQVMYAAFLILHSYMVLVDFRKDTVMPLEWVIVIWIVSFFVDEIHTVSLCLSDKGTLLSCPNLQP